MNKNFHQIGVTERRLAHDQNILNQKFNQITKSEKTLLRKSLFIELRSFTQSHFNDFMFKLTQRHTTHNFCKWEGNINRDNSRPLLYKIGFYE